MTNTSEFVSFMNKKVSIILLLFISFFAISVLSVSGLGLYWMYYPYNPIEIKEIRILSTDHRVGEDFTYEVTYRKNMDLPALVARMFVDANIIQFPSTMSNVRVTPENVEWEKHQTTLSLARIAPDVYIFKLSFTYQVNPIRQVIVSAETNCFKVTK